MVQTVLTTADCCCGEKGEEEEEAEGDGEGEGAARGEVEGAGEVEEVGGGVALSRSSEVTPTLALGVEDAEVAGGGDMLLSLVSMPSSSDELMFATEGK